MLHVGAKRRVVQPISTHLTACKRHTVKEQTGLLLICALTTHVYSRGEGVKPAGSATAFPDSDYPVPEKRISKYYHVLSTKGD